MTHVWIPLPMWEPCWWVICKYLCKCSLTFRHALTLVSPHDPTHLNFILIKYDTPFVFCVRVHARQGFKTEPDFLVQPGIGCMFGPKASENYSSIETVNNRENLWKLTSWMALLKAFLFFFLKKWAKMMTFYFVFFFSFFSFSEPHVHLE